LKKIVLLTFVLVLLPTALVASIRPVVAQGTIYIRSDGSVDPPTAPIQRDGNVYNFTGNINETIEVERDNIVIDGNGYTLQGPGLYGFYLYDRSGVTIKNTNIMGFDNGIDICYSRDNTISGNNITDNFNGIHIHFFCSGNTIKDNNITDNTNVGITIYGDSAENVIYHNNFIDNYQQASTEILGGAWDNGAEGNYWSDYTGVDSDGDGIGDTPYMIPLIEEGSPDQDRYPLMNPWIPEEEVPPPPVEEKVPFWMQWWFWTILAAGIVVLAGAVYFLKTRKPSTTSGRDL